MRCGVFRKSEPLELAGETALLRLQGDKYLAQFDNLEKFSRHGEDYAYGWHEFDRKSFKIIYIHKE